MVKTKVPQEKNIQVVVRCRWVAHKDDGRDNFATFFSSVNRAIDWARKELKFRIFMILVIQLRIISNFSAGCTEGYSRDSFMGMSFYDRRYETKIKYGESIF